MASRETYKYLACFGNHSVTPEGGAENLSKAIILQAFDDYKEVLYKKEVLMWDGVRGLKAAGKYSVMIAGKDVKISYGRKHPRPVHEILKEIDGIRRGLEEFFLSEKYMHMTDIDPYDLMKAAEGQAIYRYWRKKTGCTRCRRSSCVHADERNYLLFITGENTRCPKEAKK